MSKEGNNMEMLAEEVEIFLDSKQKDVVAATLRLAAALDFYKEHLSTGNGSNSAN